MEKKRKLPARAAARVENAKRRVVTPQRSATPAPAPAPEPEPVLVEEPTPPLPKSVAAGKPLPTVDSPQPEDLSAKDYQSVAESGVLLESLTRSRQRWISEGIFEKYWSKPTKRKGVVIEEPNNPPKESMTKLGQVTITVEPHVFEATMYAIKDPKPPPPPGPSTPRPVIQYGPPNGVMPAIPTPKLPPSVPATPTLALTQPVVQTAAEAQAQTPAKLHTPNPPQLAAPQTQAPPGNHGTAHDMKKPPPPPTPTLAAPRPTASPRGMESVLSPNTTTPQYAPKPSYGTSMPVMGHLARPASVHNNTTLGIALPTQATKPAATPPVQKGADPIILSLAEKAGEDPHLRELMKRVAQGDAAKHELDRFQAIINTITTESNKKGTPVGPSADRLLVDGRTVRYFADEVRAILDIVLSSQPNQTSADLRPPAGSDPLVVALVKAALDDMKTRDMVRRIAENKPIYSDATELKGHLDRLRAKLIKKESPKPQPKLVPSATNAAATPKHNGTVNGHGTPSSQSPTVAQGTTPQQPPSQQALRSKGPPPPPKPDISAIVFEFAGGNGDRYLFPKFSVVEPVPTPTGHQVVASFLLVRKGSKAEYPMADPELDYYQPLTIRLYTHAGRYLDHLARVVAPQEEVRRYMDDVMEKMTRAEYILLAMRLPRSDGTAESGSEEKEKEKEKETLTNGAASKANDAESAPKTTQPGVMWKRPKAEIKDLPPRSRVPSRPMDTDEQYQSFISSVSKKETREA